MKTKQEGASNTTNGMEETKAKTSIAVNSSKKEKERGRRREHTKGKKRRLDGNECRSRDTERQDIGRERGL